MITGVTLRKSQTESCTFTNLGLFNCCKERKNSDCFFTKNSEFVEVFSAKQETPSKLGKTSNHCCSFAAKKSQSTSAAAAFSQTSEIYFSTSVLVLVNPKQVHNELLLQKKEKTTAKFDFSFTLLLPP